MLLQSTEAATLSCPEFATCSRQLQAVFGEDPLGVLLSVLGSWDSLVSIVTRLQAR